MAGAPKKAPLGSEERFAAVKGQLSKRQGGGNPSGLAAFTGKRKYGPSKMAGTGAPGAKK